MKYSISLILILFLSICSADNKISNASNSSTSNWAKITKFKKISDLEATILVTGIESCEVAEVQFKFKLNFRRNLGFASIGNQLKAIENLETASENSSEVLLYKMYDHYTKIKACVYKYNGPIAVSKMREWYSIIAVTRKKT